MAQVMGITTRTLSSYLTILANRGWLEREAQERDHRGYNSYGRLRATEKLLALLGFYEQPEEKFSSLLKDRKKEESKEIFPAGPGNFSSSTREEKSEKKAANQPPADSPHSDLWELAEFGLHTGQIMYLRVEARKEGHCLSTVFAAVKPWLEKFKGRARAIIGYLVKCLRSSQDYTQTLAKLRTKQDRLQKKEAQDQKKEAQARAEKAENHRRSLMLKIVEAQEQARQDKAHDDAQALVPAWGQARQILAEHKDFNCWLRPLSGQAVNGRLILSGPNTFFLNRAWLIMGSAIKAVLGEIAPDLEIIFEAPAVQSYTLR